MKLQVIAVDVIMSSLVGLSGLQVRTCGGTVVLDSQFSLLFNFTLIL